MSNSIRYIDDKDGNHVLPVTHERAVKDSSGVNLETKLAGKENTISDLATIRSGAAAGATAYQKPASGIPKSDLASGVQTSLDYADSSLQYTPSGAVDPTITPATYATNEQLDELEAEVNEKADQAELSQLQQEVDDLSTTIPETELKVVSTNILDPDTIISDGKYVDRLNGGLDTPGYGHTDYIPIDERGLICNHTLQTGGYNMCAGCVYDANKTFIRYFNRGPVYFQEGDAYVRFSLDNPETLQAGEDYAVYRSTILPTYEPYKQVAIVKDESLDVGMGALSSEMKVNELGKNRFDSSTVTNNKYIIRDNGNLGAWNGACATDYIPVSEKGLYCNKFFQGGADMGAAVYNEYKVYIRQIGNPYTYVEGDAYVRYTIMEADLATAQVEEGSFATDYVPYEIREVINPDYLPRNSENENEVAILDIFLPEKIIAVVGDTLQIFYKGFAKAVNVLNYNVKVTCSKGRIYHRYWEYTPQSSDIGQTSFNVVVRDNNGATIVSKTCTLVTVAAPSSPQSLLNVVCIGASETTNGIWPAEVYRRLTGIGGTPVGDGLTNIAFCGLMQKDGAGYIGKSGWGWVDYCTEGRPAFRFTVGLTPNISMGNVYSNNGYSYKVIEISDDGTILCSTSLSSNTPQASGTLTLTEGSGDATVVFSASSQDSQNPFWDYENNKLTFLPYANAYCNGRIDVVYINLGVNGIVEFKTDFAQYKAYIKTFADTLHTEFPNAKLVLMSYCFPSMELMMPGYGAGGDFADTYGILSSIFNMQKAYQEFVEDPDYSAFMDYVCLANQTDSDYNYPITQKDVNTRNSSVQEGYANNTIHAGTKGYLQFADAVYRNFVRNFCQ